MTHDDDNPTETGERRVDRGPELELIAGGRASEPDDFIIDKTKKPSVFQLREVSIPPQVAAERAEQILEAAGARAAPRDTERDLTPPASDRPGVEPAHREDAEVPAATVPAARTRTRTRTFWSAVAIGLALTAVAVVVIVSGTASHRASSPAASARASAQAATEAPPASSHLPSPASAAATADPIEPPSPPSLPPKAPTPVKPPAGVAARTPPPTTPAERQPSVATVPSAFTTKPPF